MYRRRSTTSAGQVMGIIFALIVLFIVLAQCGQDSSSNGGSASYVEYESDADDPGAVPWDYRIVDGTVGDLIDGDMTILPDQLLMANDKNYATGDKVSVLEYMSATLNEDGEGRAGVALSAWRPIKSYKLRSDADADLDRLKVTLETKVELIGVYKTTLGDEAREFAVVSLPSGQRVKQPIDDDRYAQLKTAAEANILLEEVHDYRNYDLVYSKFRGWAAS